MKILNNLVPKIAITIKQMPFFIILNKLIKNYMSYTLKVTEEGRPSKGCKYFKYSKFCQEFVSNVKLHACKNHKYCKSGNFNKKTKLKNICYFVIFLCYIWYFCSICDSCKHPIWCCRWNLCEFFLYLPYNFSLLRSSFLLHHFVVCRIVKLAASVEFVILAREHFGSNFLLTFSILNVSEDFWLLEEKLH